MTRHVTVMLPERELEHLEAIAARAGLRLDELVEAMIREQLEAQPSARFESVAAELLQRWQEVHRRLS